MLLTTISMKIYTISIDIVNLINDTTRITTSNYNRNYIKE